MAGGTYTTMNKKLPGAYVNYQSVPSPSGALGDRGIATMPLALEWGAMDQVIELLSTDLTDGKALAKVGVSVFDPDSLLLRECLKHCYKLLIYRIDKGATKATATLGDITASAKHPGLKGNQVQVAIVKNGLNWDVVTFFEQAEKDRQTIADGKDLVSNDWLDFTGEGEPTATAGTPLTGATSGTVSAENYTAYLNAMKTKAWQVMGIPSEDVTLPSVVKAYIQGLREKAGKKVQAVVYNSNVADYEGIISSKQGYKTALETITPVQFIAWVTGAAAGAKINQTLCYKELDGATEIIGDLPEDELEQEITKGWFLLGKRIDGQVVVVDDLNTFTSYRPDKDQDFANNRVLRTFDEIAITTGLQFEKMFLGKVDNTQTGREIFKSQLIATFTALQDMSAIQNFKAEDLEVLAGVGKGDIKVNAYIQPVDSMKKLYMTIFER